MALKVWRVVVTELGGATPLHELALEAPNWVTALQKGRQQIGERGSVPPGASCAVAPDGKVTIMDPMARRTYSVIPDLTQSFLPRSRGSGLSPKIPADTDIDASSNGAGTKAAEKSDTLVDTPAIATPEVLTTARSPALKPAGLPTDLQVPPLSLPPANLPDFVIHSKRDEEPTGDNPLLYRERTFVVAPSTSPEAAEALLQHMFREVRDSLATRPPGKVFRFAVFDHSWNKKPQKPPIAELTWKDWRGGPITNRPSQLPMSESAGRGSIQPQASAPVPTPAKPLSEAPVPLVHEKSSPPGAADTSSISSRTSSSPGIRRRPSSPGSQPAVRGENDDRLATAFEALQDLLFLNTPADGLEFAAQLANELIPSEAISACLYDINTDELRFVALLGAGSEERKGDAVPRGAGLFGLSTQSRGAVVSRFDSIAEQSSFDPGVDGRPGLEVRNAMYMPLVHEGRLLGAMQLLNRIGHDRYDGSDEAVVVYIAQSLSEFLNDKKLAAKR